MRLLLRTYPIILLLVFQGAHIGMLAQSSDLSNQRKVMVHNRQDTFVLSAFTIVPSTLRIHGITRDSVLVDTQYYTLKGSHFIWQVDAPMTSQPDSLVYVATFRTFPYDLDGWSSRFDSALYRDGSLGVMTPFKVDPFVGNQPLLGASSGIQYDGTFSRGLALGNRQDLVLNSNFDLRLAGKLANDIEILAALSDNSIPLQPEGNTQQLQEFDKIFIQLSKGNSRLIGGDYILSKPESHFINYYKRLQGVRIENETAVSKHGRIRSAAGAGSTRGQFARINLKTQEGNQGPYRLRGNQNERFIIILANSERIYLDGKLLVRGLEQDYVIDYNAGELTFTPNRIITGNVRIVAEYEYSDQNYNRSIFTVETGYHDRKLDLQFNAYSEQDGKLTSGLTDLTADDKRFLADLGDSSDQAFSSSIRLRPEGYDANIVMYKLVDTLSYSGVLVRSTHPDSARYTAKFTLVGPGKGNYIPVTEEANGAVYAWVAPDPVTGALSGSYQPEVKLIAPQQRQMFSLGGTYHWSEKGHFTSEVSMSRYDQNRFSDRDASDDYGYAILNGLSQSFTLGRDTSRSAWLVHSEITHEYLSKSFQPLKPFRNQEFSRDWNLQNLDKNEEHLANALVSLSKGHQFDLTYHYGGFFRKGFYDGNKHVIGTRLEKGGFALTGQIDQLQSSSPFFDAKFNRPKFDISQGLGKDDDWRLGFYFEKEKNEKQLNLTDTLDASSFYYDLGRLYLSKQAGDQLSLQVSYQRRFDYLPQGSTFIRSTSADDFALQGRWNADNKSIIEATFTIRNLEIHQPATNGQRGGLNYLGRLSHKFNLGGGALRTTTNYEVSSGQEPRRTFQYLKVNPGQGVYTWIDLNGDDIQQINEFEISPFPEQAEYIRVTLLTNDFIATNNIIYNQSYLLDPRRLLNKKKSFLGKFSDQGSIRIQRKNLQNANISIWNPFALDIADSSLVSVSAQVRNVLYFNRSNPTYDIQYEVNDFRNRFVLTTGYERKKIIRHILRSRINVSRELSGLLSIGTDQTEQDSEAFDNKDYFIKGGEISPEVSWQPSSKFRLTTKYRYANKVNDLKEGETAAIHDGKLEGTINQVSTSSLRLNVALVLIDFTGQKNGALEFAMLEGLKDGTNWIWGISFDRKLMNNIRLNLSYDGRKSGSARVVHTARAQVSAFF